MDFLDEVAVLDFLHEEVAESCSVLAPAPAKDEEVALLHANAQLRGVATGNLHVDEDRLPVVAQKDVAVWLETARTCAARQFDEHRIEIGEELIVAQLPRNARCGGKI